MTQEDIRLLELVKTHNRRYRIKVSKRKIRVYDVIAIKYIGDFSSYGYEFAHDLLKHLDYNVDYC